MKTTKLYELIEKINSFSRSFTGGAGNFRLESAVCGFDEVDEEINYSAIALEIAEWTSNRDSGAVEDILKFAENTLGVKGEKTGDGNGDATVISIYTFKV